VGPTEYIVIGFEGNKFTGEILPEIKRLKEENLIRLLDALVVKRDDRGVLLTFEIADVPEMLEAASEFDAELGQWFSQDDVEQIGQVIPESSTVALLLIEHLWADGLADAILRADGSVLARTYISPQLMEEVESLVGVTPTVVHRSTPPMPSTTPPSSTPDYHQRRAA